MLFSPGWSLASTVDAKHESDDVRDGAMLGHCTRTLWPATHKSLRAASCRQAAHAALEKLDRMPRGHLTNPEEFASLCLEIDRDDALTTFEVRARGAET
jgi:hypothetical protein